jgi:hypothetical protein
MGMKILWILLTIGEFQMLPNKRMYLEPEEKVIFLDSEQIHPNISIWCLKTIPRDLRAITYNNTSGSASSLNATEIRPSCNLDIVKI